MLERVSENVCVCMNFVTTLQFFFFDTIYVHFFGIKVLRKHFKRARTIFTCSYISLAFVYVCLLTKEYMRDMF